MMKHVALVLLLGTLAGLGAHVGWYALRKPPVADSAESVLSWLQQDLKLSAEQFARVKAIHDTSEPALQELAIRASRLRAEFAAFERRRQHEGEIDFLAFAEFVEQQRAFDRICVESTRRLVAAAAGEMRPDQRERYLDRLDPVLRQTSRLN